MCFRLQRSAVCHASSSSDTSSALVKVKHSQILGRMLWTGHSSNRLYVMTVKQICDAYMNNIYHLAPGVPAAADTFSSF